MIGRAGRGWGAGPQRRTGAAGFRTEENGTALMAPEPALPAGSRQGAQPGAAHLGSDVCAAPSGGELSRAGWHGRCSEQNWLHKC